MSLKSLTIITALSCIALCHHTALASANDGITESEPGFQAAVVKVDITPERSMWLRGYAPRQSEGIHDPLFHRIVALNDGEQLFVLVSSDICSVSPSYYDEFVEDLKKDTGIDALSVWWSVTHTHSAPQVGPAGLAEIMLPERWQDGNNLNPEYSNWTKELLLEGVKEAITRLEPARLGFGVGMSMANINRRAISVAGSASLGLNPEGPVDRQIGLIRLERADGSLLALIANYAMHGTVLGGENLLISGDGPGIVSEYVEEKLGAPMLFINGAAGNIAPIYSVYPTPQSGRLMQFKVLLGDRILDANRSIASTTSDVTLWTGETTVETPLKEGFGWVDEMASYHRVASGGQEIVRIPVQVLRINDDVVIWSAPLELFSEIATDVRNQSPFQHTFYFGYTNGWMGYLTTRQAFSEGGYEPGRVSPFTERAETDFRDHVLGFINDVWNRP